MSDERPAPLAGVLRVLYSIAIFTAGLSLVLTGVFTIYEPPDGGDEFAAQFQEDDGSDQSDYQRNVGLLLTVIGATTMAASVAGLGAKANALRSGLLLTGLILFSTGVGMGVSGSDNWLVILTSGLALAYLIASLPALEDGLPFALRRGGALT
jgi:predicted phage tail protein